MMKLRMDCLSANILLLKLFLISCAIFENSSGASLENTTVINEARSLVSRVRLSNEMKEKELSQFDHEVNKNPVIENIKLEELLNETSPSEETVTKNSSLETSEAELGTENTTATTPSISYNEPKSTTDNSSNANSLSGSILNGKKMYASRLNLLEKVSWQNEKRDSDYKNKEIKQKSTNDEYLDDNRNLNKTSEIISLKTKPSKFLELLNSARESKHFEDPFSMSSILREDTFDKLFTTTDTPSFDGDKSKVLNYSSLSLMNNNVLETKDGEKNVAIKFSNSTQEFYDSGTSPSIVINSPTEVKNLSFKTKEETLIVEPSIKTIGLNFQEITQESENFTQLNTHFPKSTDVYSITPGAYVSFSEPTINSTNIVTTPAKENNKSIDPLILTTTAKTSTTPKSFHINQKFDLDEEGIEESNKASSGELHLQHNWNNDEFRTLKDHFSKRRKEVVPIYEEISRPLHIDSSIDDIEEDEPMNPKITENLDVFLPRINISIVNLIEPDLKMSIESLNPLKNSDESATRPSKTITAKFPPIASGNHESLSSSFTSAPLIFNVSPKNISNINNTRSNFVKDKDDIRIRTEAIASVQIKENQTIKSTYNETSYSIFGFNGNWNIHTRTKQTDPNLIRQHNKRVLQVQAEKMLQIMNETVNPCEDFYEYACGKWSEVYPLNDKALDNTFDRLREGLDEVLKSLLEEPMLDIDTNATKAAKILYKGCMDEEKIENHGTKPLKELLTGLGGWPALEGSSWNETEFDWVELMAVLRNYNNDILLSEWVAADITNSSSHIIQIDQPELGLPGREYFISIGDKSYRMAYMDLMMKSCELLDGDPIVCMTDMLDVLHFEQQLAKILTPAEERRNLSAVHQRLTVKQLEKEIPQINWRKYFEIVSGTKETENVIVFAMKYIKKMVRLIDNTKKRTVSNYLLWRFIKNRISNLGQEALKAKQEFIHVLFGSKSQPERWLSCVSYVNGNLGYAVGSLFVKKYYPKTSKNDSEVMIHLIRESFIEAIRNATWMSESTRQVAEEKVVAMVRNVGYPEYILNDTHMNHVFSELDFNASEHFMNVIQMLQYHAQKTHHLLSMPVNRTEWTTTPAVVNAYYSRSKNMIMFPAGILQPPFYHPAFPRSLNFGGIGVVIGHEISHGFDDRGRQFDSTGNLKQWWTNEDVSRFYDRATCMLDQYGEYKVESIGLKINAVNTLGENIADNAGLKIAYKAYQRWKKENGGEHVKLPNVKLTNDQLFFLNFGQIWCEVNSPEAMLSKIRGGQHSPNKYRVIGTLSNSEEFNAAFNCPKGMKMNPKHKCKIW